MINNMATDHFRGAVVLAVPAEVLVHDGANWARLDNSTNGSNGLSSIQLIKTAQQDCSYRIVAIRNVDNRRIMDQIIFHRLKYKEATPMFHQWRNEHRQVIGLNFPKEQDARHFYSAVRQALESVQNLQPHPPPHPQQQYSSQKSQIDNGTYQDPQNFNNNYSAYPHHQHQENNIIYATSHENAYNEGMVKMGGGQGDYVDANAMAAGQRVMERKVVIGTNGLPQFHGSINQQQQQQQQNLIRRASQGSNISSSTGGSVPGFPAPIICTNPGNGTNAHQQNENNGAGGNYGPHIPPIQNGLPPGKQISAVQQTAPPPPPPPPPPELKNALSGGKQQSFADQLRHVQLKKNSNNGADAENCHSKSSPSAASNNLPQQNGAMPRPQAGNHDFISELADRLNKRKNVTNGGGSTSTGTNGSVPPPPPPPPPNPSSSSNVVVGLNTSRNANVHSTNCHKKIPSGTSLSSQEDANSSNSIGMGNNRPTGIAEQQNASSRAVTTEDLARLKTELAGLFSEELNKMKAEMAQIVRAEIAKLITQKQ